MSTVRATKPKFTEPMTERLVRRLRGTETARWTRIRDSHLRELVYCARRHYRTGISDAQIRQLVKQNLYDVGFGMIVIQILLALLPYLLELFAEEAETGPQSIKFPAMAGSAVGSANEPPSLPPLPPSASTPMSGWKTYLAAAALAAWAVTGALIGNHDMGTATQMLLQAAALAGLRHAVTTNTR